MRCRRAKSEAEARHLNVHKNSTAALYEAAAVSTFFNLRSSIQGQMQSRQVRLPCFLRENIESHAHARAF